MPSSNLTELHMPSHRFGLEAELWFSQVQKSERRGEEVEADMKGSDYNDGLQI